ncbi:hypothetical protein GCM10023100_67040 [Actinocorallia cavernae]|uniref:Uncharacterized protein n=2 Tax=Actinomycetes TaxID=1760 RepID=A0ABP5Y5E2_9ACTN
MCGPAAIRAQVPPHAEKFAVSATTTSAGGASSASRATYAGQAWQPARGTRSRPRSALPPYASAKAVRRPAAGSSPAASALDGGGGRGVDAGGQVFEGGPVGEDHPPPFQGRHGQDLDGCPAAFDERQDPVGRGVPGKGSTAVPSRAFALTVGTDFSLVRPRKSSFEPDAASPVRSNPARDRGPDG